ncbi:MAG TPA: lysylphosphatidylglycerol synthase transmembrane domain-containing protein [Polyangia bacterium]|nr:lysylphosphatidylglycerol synthase transmembrane domain-containing protein [Polyangia bacterium]
MPPEVTRGDPQPARGPGPARWRRIAFAAIGAILSAAGIWWVFHAVDPDALLGSSHRIRVLPLLGSLAVYWLGLVVLRGLLVRHLLAPVGRLHLLQAYRYICIGFLANNVLPLRAGDVARSVAIHRGAGIGFASVVGGLALERMLDLALVALLALGAIRVAPGLPDAVGTAALGSAALLGAGFVVLAILARRHRGSTIEPAGDEGAARSLAGRARALWLRFSAGFGAFGTARGVVAAGGLAVGIWGLALGTMLLRLWAFDLEPSPAMALVLLAGLGFGVAVPSAPGYVGTYHAAAAFALSLFGVEHQVAAAFGLFSWIIDIGGSSLAGGISLSIEGMRLGDLRRRSPPQGSSSAV